MVRTSESCSDGSMRAAVERAGRGASECVHDLLQPLAGGSGQLTEVHPSG